MGRQVSIMQPPGSPGDTGGGTDTNTDGRFGDLADLLREIGGLMPSRAVIVQVHNHTAHTLRLESHHHNAGRFGEDPSQTIPPNTTEVFWSERRHYRTEGTHGWVVYQIQGQQATCKVEWRLRWRSWRRNTSSSELKGSKRNNFRLTDSMGGGSRQGEAKFELFRR